MCRFTPRPRPYPCSSRDLPPWRSKHAHPSLQGDREVVLTAMRSRGTAAVRRTGVLSLRSLTPEAGRGGGVGRCAACPRASSEKQTTSLRTNRDFVLQCVMLQGRALQYTGCALQHADPSVRSDREG